MREASFPATQYQTPPLQFGEDRNCLTAESCCCNLVSCIATSCYRIVAMRGGIDLVYRGRQA